MAIMVVPICFNSRTREGCDVLKMPVLDSLLVSIHAPARGAIRANQQPHQHQKFQFTHPRGVRSFHVKCVPSAEVSIHAPARGAIHKSDYKGCS